MPKLNRIIAIGLFKNMNKLPRDIRSAVLRLRSRKGPKIKANKKTGTVKPVFLIIYPNTPKNKVTLISNILKFIPYVPTPQSTIMIGKSIA